MSELILHIGTTKTGTTSLQRFFFKNRGKLAASGIGFPVFALQPDAPRDRNGILLNRHC